MIIKKSFSRKGSYILLDILVNKGIEHVFGYPGGAILPIYDELYFWEQKKIIKHVLVRHEQSAAHAADAYSRTTGKVGVCFATSGPGATNLVTGIATARMDSIPLIIITGQVTRAFIGTDAFQETDIFGITLPIVKHSYTVRNIHALPFILTEAFFLAQNGRPGPVLIDIPKDIGLEEIEPYSYIKLKDLIKKINYRTDYLSSFPIFNKILSYITHSYQPLFYIGGGAIKSKAFKVFQQLTKLFQIPVTTTLMGKSFYNELDYLSLGMLGMHGTAYANFSVSECDLLIALGSRFDDRVTGKLEEFASNAEVIHFDIDPAEISKNRYPQISLLGDIRKISLEFLKFIKKRKFLDGNDTKNWLKRLNNWKSIYPIYRTNYKKNNLSPQDTLKQIEKIYPNAIYTTDVGQHQMWAAQLINCQPLKWVSSSGLGTMGFGLPSAIGAKIANPNLSIICITGDSSFQMSIQELGTISQYNLNIKIFILNNGWQGMVRQWQEAFYSNRFSNSYMKNGMPSFSSVAKAYGLKGFIVDTFLEFSKLLESDKKNFNTTLYDLQIIENINCYPMIVPGKSNSQMIGLEKS